MSVSSEVQQKIEALYRTAVELNPAKRKSFLDRACAGDDFLRRQIEARLAQSQMTGASVPPSPGIPSAPQPDESSIVGQTIAHYKILSFLGRGGMGEVYLAQDTRLRRKVALKLLPKSQFIDDERLRRFEREARSASALSHPNVCVIHEIGETDDERQFIAMEHISGVTLRQRLREGPLSMGEALDIATQTASALTAAHDAGVIHRDIKPENIMLRPDGYVKVLDFGLAKLTERYESAGSSEAETLTAFDTRSGQLIGTANYLAPEQARREQVDERADIWGLGVVLYEMLTSQMPFTGETPSHTIVAILERDPEPLTHFLPDAPPELEWIAKKALRKNREQRYQAIKELLNDLDDVKQRLNESGAGRTAKLAGSIEAHPVTRHSSAFESISETLRQPRISIAFLVVALLLFGAGLFSVFRWATSKPNIPFQNMRLVKLTNTGKSASELGAVISPDGKYVAQVVDEAGQQSLVLTYVATVSNVVIAPPANVRYQGITFSRDGNYIYYVRYEKTEVGLLYQVPVLGGAPKRIMSAVDSPVAFSPDGKQLAFIRLDKGQQEYLLITAQADGSGERTLSTRKGGSRFSIYGLAWSPDGKSIACADGSFSGGFHMNVVDVRVVGGTERTVTSKKWFGVLEIAWLNDGSGMIITAAEESVSPIQIWYISYPEGRAQRITNDSSDYAGVSLTADSRLLVSVQTNRWSNISVAPNRDAGRANQIASGVSHTFRLAWAPGNRIIFSSMASGNLDIWSIRPDGTGKTQLTVKTGSNYHPAASSDGRYIFFASNRSGTFNIWRMDADGSDPKQLTNGDSDFFPSASPDGQWVVYESTSSGKPTLWKVSINGGPPAQLTDVKSSKPVVSPDGKLIACEYWDELSHSQRVAIISFEDGRQVKSFEIPVRGFQQIRWTQGGRSLTYVDVRDGIYNIWSQPIDGGPSKQLTDFRTDKIYSYDWSPDGKQLACQRGLETNDVVLISDLR